MNVDNRNLKYVFLCALAMTCMSYFCYGAANCPSGIEKLTYTFQGGSLTGYESGNLWYYNARGQIRVTLNCDQNPCIYQILASVDVYCDYSEVNGNPEGFDSSGTAGAYPASPLCSANDFAIITVHLVNASYYEPVSARWYKEPGVSGDTPIGYTTY